MANVTGWGRGTWGEGAWSEEVPITLSGLSVTSGLGSVSVTASAVVSEDSVVGASAVGDVSSETFQVVRPTSVTGTGQNTAPDILGDANFSITGVNATTAVGTVDAQSVAEVTGASATGGTGTITMIGTAVVVPTGVEDTGQIGTPFIFLEQKIPAPSFLATGAVGDASIEGIANIFPTGVSSSTDVGSVVPFAGSDVNVTGEEATSALGTVTPFAGAKPTPSGVSAVASNVFVVVAVGDANVYPTGVSGSVGTSSPNVWSQITPSVSQTWSEVAA